MLQAIFIRRLVPWNTLVGPPNEGHEAIADFLMCGAIDHALTTNFDWLVERVAWDRLGTDFVASLESAEAVINEPRHKTLFKAHGCGLRDRDNTVWTRRQLAGAPVVDRIAGLRDWLAVRLRHKDLVIGGFWTDWDYLILVLEQCLATAEPTSVTVVDPAPAADLENRSPALWATLHRPGIDFEHLMLSAAEVLDGLREAFSRWYARQVLQTGAAIYNEAFGAACLPDWLQGDDIPKTDLYTFRRDAECVRIGRAARRKTPDAGVQNFAFFNLALLRTGAQREGAFFRLGDGRLVRVLNGAGRWLKAVEREYAQEPPGVPVADVVMCVGAEDYGAPASVVRGGAPSSVVRPAGRGAWLDTAGARALVGL